MADPVGAGVSDYLELRGWKIEGASLRVGDHAYDTDFGYWRPGFNYSQILLALDVARGARRCWSTTSSASPSPSC